MDSARSACTYIRNKKEREKRHNFISASQKQLLIPCGLVKNYSEFCLWESTMHFISWMSVHQKLIRCNSTSDVNAKISVLYAFFAGVPILSLRTHEFYLVSKHHVLMMWILWYTETIVRRCALDVGLTIIIWVFLRKSTTIGCMLRLLFYNLRMFYCFLFHIWL